MKFTAANGRIKDVRIQHLLIDWSGDFGSKFEKEVAAFLYPYWRRDVVVAQLPVPSTRMTIDFFNVSRRIAIEVQGRQHQTYVPFMAGSRAGFLSQIKRDINKSSFCERNDITLVEIFPEDMPLSTDLFKDRYSIDL